MSLLDLVLLGVLLVSGLLGLWRGFVVEVMSLASWALAFWAAFAFGERVAAVLEGWIDSGAVSAGLGYLGCFIMTLLAGGVVTWLVVRVVEGTGLSGTDRLLGFVFGLFRGAALCVLGVLLLGLTPLPASPQWAQSPLVASLQPGALWLRSWLPEPLAAQIRLIAESPLAATPESSPPPRP